MKRTLSLLLPFFACAAHAQYAVVPGAYANTAASTSGFNLPLSSSARTGQMLISSSQLGGIAIGSQITGISFRLYTGANKNFGGATWSDYSISMGAAVAPTDGSTTLADNFLSTPTSVRSGALTIASGGLTKGGSPNAWGVEITFDHAYTYTGGNLGIEINHSASAAAIPSGTNLLEIAKTSSAGYTNGDYRFYSGSDGTASDLTGSKDSFVVSRLTVAAPVPEPSTFAAIGLGAAALLRRRRKA